jgi:hypothetical protein
MTTMVTVAHRVKRLRPLFVLSWSVLRSALIRLRNPHAPHRVENVEEARGD